MRKILIFILSLLITNSIFRQFIINEEPIVLKTETGDIHGILKIPPTNSKAIPLAILIAGSGPTDRNGNQPQMQNNSLKMLLDALFHNGIATLSYDKRGIGESREAVKDEADLRFEDYVNDAKGWSNLLYKDERFSSIAIIGHSEGSLIGMIAAQNNTVTKYISLAGIAEPASSILKEQLAKQLATQPQTVKDMIFSYIDKLEKGETIENVPISLHSLFRPSVQPYMISWFKYNPQEEIKKLNIPILLIQGSTDIQVSVKQAELLSKAQLKAQKVIIENMNHVLKDCENTDQTTQLSLYNNPNIPINKQLIKEIVRFIK